LKRERVRRERESRGMIEERKESECRRKWEGVGMGEMWRGEREEDEEGSGEGRD
jgi:hypothetical protein